MEQLYQKISRKIKAIRLTKSFTQKYMADKLNFDLRTYRRIENGKRKNLDIETTIKIASILSCDISEIFLDQPFNNSIITIKKYEELLIQKENIINNLLSIIKFKDEIISGDK